MLSLGIILKFGVYTLLGGGVLYFLIFILLGIRIIKSNEVAVVEKWWSKSGNLKDGKFIALNGEAGFQPDVLRTGIHLKSSLMYKIHKVPVVTIPQGQIGYVFARDGEPLEGTQKLGASVECSNFQDTRAFLENGGQKGPQRAILREGTYAFNLAQFLILTEADNYYLSIGNPSEESEINSMSKNLEEQQGFRPVIICGGCSSNDGRKIVDPIGIVTVHDGPSLRNGEVIAPLVGDNSLDKLTYHNNFQNPEAFLRAGGFRGKQYQVISDSTYFINRLFATVELCEKTTIGIGYAGVVNSFIGEKGEDVTGDSYGHGELVKEGCRGIWEVPLMPGKYSFNKYAGTIIQVPTTNFILKWIDNQSGGHKFDENLKEVTLITKDAFEPTLPLSVVVHIDYRKASLVIQRFGDIKRLVDQTLDPMVSAYFKNIAQQMTLIELIQNRSVIQERATNEMKKKFLNYNLNLEEVLIGTPTPNNDSKIEEILKQLSDRQLAIEKISTYESEMKASETEKKLKEFQAKAEQQEELTKSEINIKIQDNVGKAELERAKQDAEKEKTLTDAEVYKIEKMTEVEAMKISKMANAESEKEAKVGIAKALAISEQVKAYGGPQYQVMQDVLGKFTEAIKEGNINIVPNNVVSMGNNNGNVNAVESLIGILLSEKFSSNFDKNENKNKENEYAESLKKEMLKNATFDICDNK